MVTYLVIGASQGIGLALADALSKNREDKVIATQRKESTELRKLTERKNVVILNLDVADQKSIAEFGEKLKATVDSIDIAIFNSAVAKATTPLLETTAESWTEHFVTNSLGPVLVYPQVHPLLLKSDIRKVFFMSSTAGSIQEQVPYPVDAYGASKAHLNYSVRKLSQELAGEHFTIVLLHPGTVSTNAFNAVVSILAGGDTELEEGARNMAITPETCAQQILAAIKALEEKDNGRFVQISDLENVSF
ncbi:hypothetical protein OGAPHI_001363 [Ogataea philodendri]|uniref:NAD(P)-binding protein n=1 Tax=Ogataea philodendri TaxID=1378263 RepID=A0A9P8PC30_9ASCO|nr:uncharacterized protein OGAPHI_001363 [Ogataea philodendri]KAH3669242.1 hypothetical protein OGAPHI_001363 [Ogataea philodendri]